MLTSGSVCQRSGLIALGLVVLMTLCLKTSFADETQTGAQGAEGAQSVRIGNVARITDEFRSRLSDGQLKFYDTLMSAPGIVFNDGLPYGRLVELYKREELDCVIDQTHLPTPATIFSSHEIRFEMVIFGRRGENLFDRNVVTVGYLATLPQFPVPFVQPVEWYGLRTIQQGAELVKIGRIDVLIAHAGMFRDDPLIETMPFPPVRVVELTLQCHDTPAARDFLAAFDRQMNLVRERSDQSMKIKEQSAVMYLTN